MTNINKKIAFCITTYNRLGYLKKLLDTYYETRNNSYYWNIYIADDGSIDGTLEFLETLKDIKIIKLNRIGVHEATNKLFDCAINNKFDFGFKLDDDVFFINKGWDDLYINAYEKTGYDHLVLFDQSWSIKFKRHNHFKKNVIIHENNILQTYLTNPFHAQGAFFTFTPNLINKIGWFDDKTFPKYSGGHLDYTIRACRAGLNKLKPGPWDIKDSQKYIKLQQDNYYNVKKRWKRHSKEIIIKKRKALKDNDRIYIKREKYDHMDINQILDLLKNNINFSFIRFNDGEMNGIIRDDFIASRGCQIISKDIKEKLIEAITYRDKNYYLGYPCPVCCSKLKEVFDKYVEKDYEYLLPAVLLNNNYNWERFINFLIDFKKDVIYICGKNSNIDNLHKKFSDLNFINTIFVSEKNAWADYSKIKDTIYNISPNSLIMLSCGPLGRILGYEWWKIRKDCTILDIGSIFDPFTKNKYYRYQKNNLPFCYGCHYRKDE